MAPAPMAEKKKRERKTADELLAELEADPEFVRRRATAEERRLAQAAELAQAEEPVVAELRAAGCDVESVWDLVNTGGTYTQALPVLLKHLTRPYPPPILAGIARALAVPESGHGWQLLTTLFAEQDNEQVKDGLAVAIAKAAADAVIDDVIALVRDPRHGPSRLLLLSALARSRLPQARAALFELQEDSVLAKEIRVILRRLERTKK